MRRLLLISLGLLTLLIFKPLTLSAETSRLRLPILPMDCVFDTVQDGSNEIIYLTPEECGQLIDDDENIKLPRNRRTNQSPIDRTLGPIILRPRYNAPNLNNISSTSTDSAKEPSFFSSSVTTSEEQPAGKQFNPAIILQISVILFITVVLRWLILFFS